MKKEITIYDLSIAHIYEKEINLDLVYTDEQLKLIQKLDTYMGNYLIHNKLKFEYRWDNKIQDKQNVNRKFKDPRRANNGFPNIWGFFFDKDYLYQYESAFSKIHIVEPNEVEFYPLMLAINLKQLHPQYIFPCLDYHYNLYGKKIIRTLKTMAITDGVILWNDAQKEIIKDWLNQDHNLIQKPKEVSIWNGVFKFGTDVRKIRSSFEIVIEKLKNKQIIIQGLERFRGILLQYRKELREKINEAERVCTVLENKLKEIENKSELETYKEIKETNCESCLYYKNQYYGNLILSKIIYRSKSDFHLQRELIDFVRKQLTSLGIDEISLFKVNFLPIFMTEFLYIKESNDSKFLKYLNDNSHFSFFLTKDFQKTLNAILKTANGNKEALEGVKIEFLQNEKKTQKVNHPLFFAATLRQTNPYSVKQFLQYHLENDEGDFLDFLTICLKDYKEYIHETNLHLAHTWIKSEPKKRTIKVKERFFEKNTSENYIKIKSHLSDKEIRHFFSFMHKETNAGEKSILSENDVEELLMYGFAVPNTPSRKYYKLDFSDKMSRSIVLYCFYRLYRLIDTNDYPNQKDLFVRFLIFNFENFKNDDTIQLKKKLRNIKPRKMKFNINAYLP